MIPATKLAVLVLVCGTVVGQNTANKNPLIEGNVAQSAWVGQSDQSVIYSYRACASTSSGPCVATSGISMAYPLVTNHWADYMVPEFKAGTILYVAPWPQLPIPEALRKGKPCGKDERCQP